MGEPVIIVHGGAGNWPRNRQDQGLRGVRLAVASGFELLSLGGSSLDAVQAAVISLENNPVFNAGTGSTLNLVGDVETDAAIMEGSSLQGAGVALVRGIKNPIRLARLVMENTDHVLIAGQGAQKIARAHKLPEGNLKVKSRVAEWRRARQEFKRGRAGHFRKNLRLLRTGTDWSMDTVGALALDARGNLAAACSTGGVLLKLPGRIGDSAILGAGLYADDEAGAATATGLGEIAMRLVISKTAVELMTHLSARSAAVKTLQVAGRKMGPGLGIITLDRNGGLGVAHNTSHLCWAARNKEGSTGGISGVRTKPSQ